MEVSFANSQIVEILLRQQLIEKDKNISPKTLAIGML